MRRVALLLLPVFMTLAGSAMAGEHKPFSPAALQTAQSAGKPIVVHVTAPWCSTCQAQEPIVKSILSEPKFKNLVVLDLDYDSDKANMHKLGVQDRSAFVAFKGKMQVARSSGDTEPKKIHHLFDQTL